jgi:hypothetical protein
VVFVASSGGDLGQCSPADLIICVTVLDFRGRVALTDRELALVLPSAAIFVAIEGSKDR